jgi:PDZ domain-containing protein
VSRRGKTLTVASVLLAVFTLAAFSFPLPYVIESPGPTENTLGSHDGKDVISITGHRTYPTEGHLNLTTVSFNTPDYEPRLAEVFKAWVDPRQAVLPRDAVYPPHESAKQSERVDTEQMLGSQSAAIAAALRQAGYRAFAPTVGKVTKGAPADGKLQSGDGILEVGGRRMANAQAVINAISPLRPGTRTTLTIRRDYRDRTVTLVTEPNPQAPTRSRIGVAISESFNPPFKVSIKLGQHIGGPSAGLLFSLAIYDKLTPGALTGGRFVAGTGTIDQLGRVGPIGGIQQKITGAKNSGATIFLVPAADCSEAADAPDAHRIELVKVATIGDAISVLHALARNPAAKVPSCS